MGNSLGGKKRRSAQIMKIDGTTFLLKPPVQAKDVLQDHPGYDLLDADDVKKLGVRAGPLRPESYLQKGKLYFLIELPKPPPENKGVARRAWSGALLHVSAKERLESLKLSRRSHSDLSLSGSTMSSAYRVLEQQQQGDQGGGGGGGGLRVRMRLPKAEVARVMGESKDAGEAAARIMEMCMAREQQSQAKVDAPVVSKRKEKRTRFMPMPEEIIA